MNTVFLVSLIIQYLLPDLIVMEKYNSSLLIQYKRPAENATTHLLSFVLYI